MYNPIQQTNSKPPLQFKRNFVQVTCQLNKMKFEFESRVLNLFVEWGYTFSTVWVFNV